MWSKRSVITGLAIAACVALINGPAYGQTVSVTWLGEMVDEEGQPDCNWSTSGNWSAQVIPINHCYILSLFDSDPCQTTFIDNGLPTVGESRSYFPLDVHIGHNMIMHFPWDTGIWVTGMMYITGSVVFEGPTGIGIKTHGLRLGEIGSFSGASLTNTTDTENGGGVSIQAGFVNSECR